MTGPNFQRSDDDDDEDATSHPSWEILLEEFLKAYNPPVSQAVAAERMHMPAVRLNQLIRGNRGVTPDTALLLSALTRTSAQFWMNLQAAYDLWVAQDKRQKEHAPKVRPLVAKSVPA